MVRALEQPRKHENPRRHEKEKLKGLFRVFFFRDFVIAVLLGEQDSNHENTKIHEGHDEEKCCTA
jgi:hypothetical protein